MKNLSFKISSTRENVRFVEKYIEDAKEEYHIDEDVYGNMVVAITESVTNAIVHGNKLDSNKSVNLQMNMSDSKICIEVADEGAGYEYENVPDPTAPENLGKPGGRGLFLMRHLCDKVNFLENGRIVQLVFHVWNNKFF